MGGRERPEAPGTAGESVGSTAPVAGKQTLTAGLTIQRKAAGGAGDASPATASTPPADVDGGTASGAAETAGAGPASLIVDAAPVGPEQMLKSTFIDQLRTAVTAAAAEELGPLGAVAGCPYIDQYFGRYANRPAAAGESLLRRYAPRTRQARTAGEMIPIVVERARQGIRTWRQTGQIPPDLAAADPAGAAAAATAVPPAGGAGATATTAPTGGPAPVQAKAAPGTDFQPHAPEAVLARLGPGQPLDASTGSRLGGAMGDDFGGVRVHTDASAGSLAGEMNARAFTVGQHVAFAPGQFQPGTPEGDALLAHELAHVQQQRGAESGAQAKDAGGASGEAAEADADQGAMSAIERLYRGGEAAVGRAGSSLRTGVSLRRCEADPGSTEPPAAAGPVAAEKTEDYVLHFGEHDFVVSFELLPGSGVGMIRTTIQPVNWSRVYQKEKKYWDVRGREVGPDDSYTSMGVHSVDAAPYQTTLVIPDRTKFRGAFPKPAKSGAESVYEIDIDGDGKPDFDLHCAFNKTKITTSYDFALYGGGAAARKFDYHYIADDAWKHGYSGNHSPRRQPDDFFESLTTLFDIGVSMIPIVGDIVDLAEAVTGYTKWGKKMTTAERAITGLAVLIPFAGGAVLRKATKGGMSLAEAALKMGKTEDEVIAALKAIDGRAGDKATIEAMEASVKAGRELTKSELRQLNRILHQVDAEKRTFRAIEQAAGAEGVMRRGGKIAAETGPVSIKRLRNTLGRAGVSPSPYHLRKATEADLKAIRESGADPSSIYAWVSRDGAGKVLRDHRGRPIINFTQKGLSSLEEAVKSYGHEVQHLKDFAAGRGTTEAGAEKAGEELWKLVSKARGG